MSSDNNYTVIWYLSGSINAKYSATGDETYINNIRKKFAKTISLRKTVYIVEAIYKPSGNILGEVEFNTSREFREYANQN